MDTNRMPAQGSSDNTIFTPYTGVLPDNVSIALNAGISFFKVMCIGVPTGTTIFGFYDVDVKQILDQINVSNRPKFDYRWHRGRGFEKNNIRLWWDKKSNRSYAYIPDDPAWKNRLIFAGMQDSGKYVIAQYLTPKGLIDGAVMTEQIKFIGQKLYDNVVTCGKDTLFRGKSLKEAKAAEEKAKAEGKACQTVLLHTPEILTLIKKYGPMWTHQDEFINGIRAQIELELDAMFTMVPQQAPATIEDPKAFLKDAFSMLTPQERLELFQSMASASGGAVESSQHPVGATKVPPAPIPAAAVLENMPMPALKELAEDHDIFTGGMQREDIIKELKEKSGQQSGAQQKAKASKAAPAAEPVVIT